MLLNLFWLITITLIIFVTRKIKSGPSSMIKELLAGLILGNLSLLGIHFFNGISQSKILEILAEIAIAFFLFRVGFSVTITDMLQIGARALAVAILGVAGTFALALYFVPFLIPSLNSGQYIFIAAALSTTSVGITARIMKDYGLLESSGAQIVLGAAVFDDIISLLILATIIAQPDLGFSRASGMNLAIAKILLFIVAGIFIGQIVAKVLPKIVHKIHPHLTGEYFIILLFFTAFFLGSKAVGLSPIVGAFIGGLVLEQKHFDIYRLLGHGKRLEMDIEKASNFFVPIFFILTGAAINLSVLFSLQTLGIAWGLLIIAFVGKMVCALAARKSDNRWLVGLGMVPRGEVGLIFANIAYATNIIPQTVASAIVIVVIGTTLIIPFILKKVVN